MLFNSYGYIFIFLPITLIAFYISFSFGKFNAAIVILAAASLFFYGYWAWEYIPLLIASILLNFTIGRYLEHNKEKRKIVLILGVSINLALLILFKYTNFFADQLNFLVGVDLHLPQIVLPLGISFFTFTQIAYLVDLSRGVSGRYDVWRYTLFVTFFPHLLAGPILHHREMMPQFGRRLPRASYERHISYGLLIFAIGLFKKVWLADSVAPYANAAFDGVAHGASLSFAAAWWGALAYTLQLYFDFSGYSDMAIGGARMFGIRLPLNFNAPYRATSIIEFWRRWHMTLSRFLRDYLYVSLGGNRLGMIRRYVNLIVTMALGGIWHGAGYGFLLWGLFHGALLALNHGWRTLRIRIPFPASFVESLAGFVLTFCVVVFGWVFFRAASLDAAGRMIYAMAGIGGIASDDVVLIFREGLRIVREMPASLLALGILDIHPILLPTHPVMGSIGGIYWLFPLLMLCALGPTSQQIATSVLRYGRSDRRLRRRIADGTTIFVSILFLLSLARLNHVSEFLYFQF